MKIRILRCGNRQTRRISSALTIVVVGKLFPSEREGSVDQIYRRNARVSIAVILPPPWKLHPKFVLVSIHEFPPLFVTLVLEATYLYTSLRIVITNHQNYHSRDDRFLWRKISSSFHDALVLIEYDESFTFPLSTPTVLFLIKRWYLFHRSFSKIHIVGRWLRGGEQ